MAAEKHYARLGLFVVVGVIVMLATGLFFIQRQRSREVITMVTYFTENVSGLDISSPVRFRGVSVGRVSNIGIDPNGGTIEVGFEIFKDRLTTVGADVKRVQAMADLAIAPNTRARVVANPLTGDAYLLLDNPSNAPPPIGLGFTPPRAYVPSMPSPLTAVQDRVPAVLERAEQALQTLRTIIDRVPASLDRSDRFFTNIERIARDSHLPELSAELRASSTEMSAQIAQIRSDVDRLTGADGTLLKFAEEARSAIREANVPASTQAARNAADRTSLAADDLRRALPEIRETLAQLRELTRRLDEQPESVVYGPRPPRTKAK
jgi:paraquat-inducible protein B